MIVNIVGTVKEKQAVQTFKNDFKKQSLILVNKGGQYDDYYNIEFLKEGISALSNINIGDKVNVSAAISSREYEGNYYTNIKGLKIQVVESNDISSPDELDDDMPSAPLAKEEKRKAAPVEDMEDDSLPF